MKVEWFEQQQAEEADFQADELAEQAQAYEVAAREDLRVSEKVWASQIDRLQEISDEYMPKLADALQQIDPDAARSLEEELAAETGPREDFEEVAARIKAIEADYAGLIEKAFASLEIDRDALVANVQSAMNAHRLPRHLTVQESQGGMACTALSAGEPEPEPDDLTLRAPYSLRAVSYSGDQRADAAAGQVRSEVASLVAGSVQGLASVGSLFRARERDGHIRVEATVNLDHCFVSAIGLGYFSAEALLNLKVLDGSRVVGSDRKSLAHTAVAAWAGGGHIHGRHTLACQFGRGSGTSANLAAIVEAETWAGGAGAGSARAELVATAEEIRVFRS